MNAKLDISIKALGDAPTESAYWHDAKPLTFKKLLIVEGATGGGRTGVGLYLEDDKGNKFYANTTGRIVNAMAAATRGAMQRFGDDPDKD